MYTYLELFIKGFDGRFCEFVENDHDDPSVTLYLYKCSQRSWIIQPVIMQDLRLYTKCTNDVDVGRSVSCTYC